jgi:hypothetical protein
MRARLLTKWVQRQPDGEWDLALSPLLSAGARTADVTGQPCLALTPPLPNLVTVETDLDATATARLVADPDHGADSIVLTESNAGLVPSDAAFLRVRTWLAVRGLTLLDLTAAVGDAVNGRTRGQIERAAAAWLKSRPKAPLLLDVKPVEPRRGEA